MKLTWWWKWNNHVVLPFPGKVRDTSFLFKEQRQKRSRMSFCDCYVTLHETSSKYAHFQMDIMIYYLSTPWLSWMYCSFHLCSRKNLVFLFGALINLTVRGQRIFSPKQDDLSYSVRTIFQGSTKLEKARQTLSLPQKLSKRTDVFTVRSLH